MTRETSRINFDHLKCQVLSYFDQDHSKIQPAVPLEEQQHELHLLNETLKFERFFFVVDLLDFKIAEANGISTWLGYPEKEFSLKQYWEQLMHPGFKPSLLLLADELYKALCLGKYELRFMVQRFVTLLPLKHYNGHYVLMKKTSSPFQYDKNNRLLAYLDEFTIIGTYTEGEAMSPRIIDTRKETSAQEIIARAQNALIKMKAFSVQELQVMRKLAYHPRITQGELAQQMGLTVNTVNTYYKRFTEKARDFFREEFPTALDAAKRLRNDGLL